MLHVAHAFIDGLELLSQLDLLRVGGLQICFLAKQLVQEEAESRERRRFHLPPATSEAPDKILCVLGRLAGGSYVALTQLAHEHQASRAIAAKLVTARWGHQILFEHRGVGQVIYRGKRVRLTSQEVR